MRPGQFGFPSLVVGLVIVECAPMMIAARSSALTRCPASSIRDGAYRASSIRLSIFSLCGGGPNWRR